MGRVALPAPARLHGGWGRGRSLPAHRKAQAQLLLFVDKELFEGQALRIASEFEVFQEIRGK
jgi:hypothetical protein